MTEPDWLAIEDVTILHGRQIRRFGGLPGIRGANAVESAITRPRQKLAYESPDLADLAAAYGFGHAKNHGFSDGNKRFAAVIVFLDINGHRLTAAEPEAVAVMLGVASGELGEAELAVWIRRSMVPLSATLPR